MLDFIFFMFLGMMFGTGLLCSLVATLLIPDMFRDRIVFVIVLLLGSMAWVEFYVVYYLYSIYIS